MEKLQIRYIQQGIIEVDLPKKWEDMTNSDRHDFCQNILNSKSDSDLIDGLREVKEKNNSGEFFAETPSVEAIQIKDDFEVSTVACSDTWRRFIWDEGGLSWSQCPQI